MLALFQAAVATFLQMSSGVQALILICGFFLASHAMELAFRVCNRWLRHRNIVARGWPPAHIDADGDLRDGGEP